MGNAPIHLHPARPLLMPMQPEMGPEWGVGACHVCPELRRTQSGAARAGRRRFHPQDGTQKLGVGRRPWSPVLPVTRLELPGGERSVCTSQPAAPRVLPPRLTRHHAGLHLRVCFPWLTEPFYKVVLDCECIAYMTSIHPWAHSQAFLYARI